MGAPETEQLRVLVADESKRALEPVGEALRGLGHEVIALAVEPEETARATHEHRPDLAIVALHEDSGHALELIRGVVDEATCPVCLLAADPSREFLSEAARHGVFAHLDSTDATELAGGIDIAVERYRQFRDLLGAFDRRARIERAKGLLMERHGIGEPEAFERLRRQARDTRRPIMGVVDDVLG
jgi:AmiR/NasT family two-component response regulator